MSSDKQSVTEASYSAVAELNGSCASYALSVSTGDATIDLPPGHYLAWLLSGNPGVSVFAKNGGAPTVPTSGGGAQANTYGFPGGGTERIRVPSGAATTTVHFKATASDTLYLVLLP